MKNFKNTSTIDILKLTRSENVGVKTFYSLVSMFGSAKKALQNIEKMSLKGGRNKPIKVYSDEEIDQEIRELDKLNGTLVSYKDTEYSKLLMQISDPPPIISCIGNLELLNRHKIIAIVGSRNASISGKSFASKLSKDLYESGFTIVSGLARGIDAGAHESAIDNTIAVIAGGIGNVYPFENRHLYEKISKDGLIISELRANSMPLAQHFPQRNRIISGLSIGVVVVEATMNSGSLITARFAAEQNREVFAIPGFPTDPRSHGTNKLIKSGAHIVDSVSDIITNLPEYMKLLQDDKFIVSDKQAIFSNTYPEISDSMRNKVIFALSKIPINIELLHKELDIPVIILHTIILEFELAGKVFRDKNNRISLMY